MNKAFYLSLNLSLEPFSFALLDEQKVLFEQKELAIIAFVKISLSTYIMLASNVSWSCQIAKGLL